MSVGLRRIAFFYCVLVSKLSPRYFVVLFDSLVFILALSYLQSCFESISLPAILHIVL